MLRKYFLDGLIISLLALNLAGCLTTVDSEISNNYLITSIPDIKTTKTQPLILSVRTPQTNYAYNSTQMAYATEGYKINYFAKNSWAATPSQMLLPLMVQTLQNTQAFSAVIPQSVYGHTDLILDTQILQLQQDFTQQTGQLHLVIRAQLSNVNSQRILATQEFIVTEPIAKNNPSAGVTAANRATNKFLQQLAEFVITNARKK